jgi:hypothetical protein
VRNRFKDAGITLEQIVDGTTGCNIWFHIDVTERKCFMSEEEQIDGSVVLNLSGIEDWATIPPNFYQLSGREVKGAYTCVFGSFIVDGQPYTLLESIPAQEVIDQGFFEPLNSAEASSTNSVQLGPKSLESSTEKKQDGQIKSAKHSADNGPEFFPFSKSALLLKYETIWPTIERDISDASKNGLDAAKAGRRKWNGQIALNWARANNKIKDHTSGPMELQNAMSKFPPGRGS